MIRRGWIALLVAVVSAWAVLVLAQPGNPSKPYGSTEGDKQRTREYNPDGDRVAVNLKKLSGTPTPAGSGRCEIRCAGATPALQVSISGSGYQAVAGPSGCECTGSGTSSTNVGTNATSTGNESVAVGQGAHANALRATALGRSADATEQFNTAVGYAALADGSGKDLATALGATAHALGQGATAVGYAATTSADGSTVVGTGAGGLSVGANATCLGTTTNCSGADALAVGISAQATGATSTAVGGSAQATDTDATALGNLATATNGSALALGAGADAGRDDCIALGAAASCSADGQLKIGGSGHLINEIVPQSSTCDLGTLAQSFNNLYIANVHASAVYPGPTGTGSALCLKSDGSIGKCSDAPNGSGVCTCG